MFTTEEYLSLCWKDIPYLENLGGIGIYLNKTESLKLASVPYFS